MTIHCFDIKYDVSDETLDIMDDCHEAIIMPEELDIDIDEEDFEEFKDDLEDYIANEISNQIGFLVESFEYEFA